MIKVGMSIYSLFRAIRDGRLTPLDAVAWIADHGGEHIEIVPGNVLAMDDPDFVGKLRAKADACGLPISCYSIGGDFLSGGAEHDHPITEKEYDQEIERLKGQVDIAVRLGAKAMRHGVCSWTDEKGRTPEQFEVDVRQVVRGCRAVADYAARSGITTSVENHGRYFQASARIRQLVKLVDRPNYRTTIDVGNFTGIDELPQAALLDLIEFTSGVIHFKDYYIRDWIPAGKGFGRTAHGRFTRGAIPGFGDLNMREIVRIIREAKFDGFISIEYEGKEDCLEGAELSLENVRAMFA